MFTTLPYLAPRLRICGAKPFSPYTPARHGQEELYSNHMFCCQLCKKLDPYRFWHAPEILMTVNPCTTPVASKILQ
jgi:hypothetical protein